MRKSWSGLNGLTEAQIRAVNSLHAVNATEPFPMPNDQKRRTGISSKQPNQRGDKPRR